MKPEDVKPEKFKDFTIIYQNDDFAVAYGYWNHEAKPRLAMRWNGYGDSKGYPSQGGNPLWFQLPNTGVWTSGLLKAINVVITQEQIDEFEEDNKL